MPASKEGTTQYRDALYSKGSEVIPWVVETTGAVCPHGVDEIRRCSRSVATRDLTKYTDSGPPGVSRRTTASADPMILLEEDLQDKF